MAQWGAVDKDDIFAVLQFRKDHPDSPLETPIVNLLNTLKRDELARISQSPGLYRADRFMALRGVCTDDELLESIGQSGNPRAFELIQSCANNDVDVINIPAPGDYTGVGEGRGNTDIVLFGTKNSGKTCLLTGLFSNKRLTIDSTDWCGQYGLALQSYGSAEMAPPRTNTGFVTVVECHIYVKDNKEVRFNLVDMSGEEYTNTIVRIGSDSSQQSVSFADMGSGFSEIIAGKHPKVFVLVLDPTATGAEYNIQRQALRTLMAILRSAENRDVMSRVMGLHIIVTKTDTLGKGRQRQEAATRYVRELIGDGDARTLINFCCELGINNHADKRYNGHPNIYCYSLGNFMPGGMFIRNAEDSNVILDMISDYVAAERVGGTSIREFLTNRF